MSDRIEIVIPEFGEVPDELWDRVEAEALKKYSDILRSEEVRDPKIEIRNIGRGVDWSVVVISIVSAFFAIPKAHKLLRETVEEWLRIYRELAGFVRKLAPRKAFLPDSYLFLVALDHILPKVNSDETVFQGSTRIPSENPDRVGYEDLIFHFTNVEILHHVCVSRSGKVLWASSLELIQVDA